MNARQRCLGISPPNDRINSERHLSRGWRSPIWVGAGTAIAGAVLAFTNSHEEQA